MGVDLSYRKISIIRPTPLPRPDKATPSVGVVLYLCHHDNGISETFDFHPVIVELVLTRNKTQTAEKAEE